MKFEKERTQLKVISVYNSLHQNKNYKEDDYFVTEKREELHFTLEGIVDDRHFGYETISGGRFTTLYEKGTLVRNNRMWSAISPAEIAQITANLGIAPQLTPELLGINLLIDGIDDLSTLGSMTYLVFSPHDTFEPKRTEDVVLVVYAQALPCRIAGKALVEPYKNEKLESQFPAAALGKRATTGWVEKGGIIKPGYNVWAMIPRGYD